MGFIFGGDHPNDVVSTGPVPAHRQESSHAWFIEMKKENSEILNILNYSSVINLLILNGN